MEHHEIQRQEGVELPSQAPPSLLNGILNRLEQRRVYLTADMPVQELIAALQHSQWDVRSAAVHALGESGEQTPLEPLLGALHDEHRMVRVAAVRALGRQGQRAPLEHLLLAMKDSEWEVREMAVLTLAEMGARAPDPLRAMLQSALQDTQSNVRDAAMYALRKYDDATALGTPGETQSASLPAYVKTSRSLTAKILHIWSLLRQQVALIHKSIWITTPLLLCLWFVLTLFSRPADWQSTISFLVLFITVSAAAGTAFIYGGEHDPGFELTLSTPTSIRTVMFCRFLLVTGYNIVLAGGISALVALLHGGGIWEIVHLWLGPMILLSSLTLAVSLLIGTWLAMLIAFIVEASQTLVLNIDKHLPTLDLVISKNWQTTPTVLILALLLLGFALLYAPRQPRLAAF